MSYNSVGPICFEPVTAVTATPSVDLGNRRSENGCDYVYVYNACNSSILTGNGAVLISGATDMSMTVTSVSSVDFCQGVAVNTLTTGTYGWLCTRGIVNVEMKTTSGSVAALQCLELGVVGEFVPYSNTTSCGKIVGQALNAIVSGASGSAFISVY